MENSIEETNKVMIEYANTLAKSIPSHFKVTVVLRDAKKLLSDKNSILICSNDKPETVITALEAKWHA